MKGFKTIFAGLATFAIGMLEQYDVTDIVPEKFDDLALAGVGVLMVLLRMVTTTPVGKSD